jgi:hypothetical protein
VLQRRKKKKRKEREKVKMVMKMMMHKVQNFYIQTFSITMTW